MLFGDRLTKLSGCMIFEDNHNKLKAIIKMESDEKKGMFSKKKYDLFNGKIYYKKTENPTIKYDVSLKDNWDDELKYQDKL